MVLKKILVNLVLFLRGNQQLKKTGQTPLESYYALRKLFVITNGRFNDVFRFFNKIWNPPYKKLPAVGLLTEKDGVSGSNYIKALDKDGYHIFKQSLSHTKVKNIVDFANSTPARYLNTDSNQSVQGYSREKIHFDPFKIISPRYQYDIEDLLACPELVDLVFDLSLLEVAQSYLKCKPVLDLVTMWWSAPFQNRGTSEAAQEYHFDMDRINFIKFFFYLTDVTDNTGPHCFIRGSHKRLPMGIMRDGRFSDSELAQYYKPEEFMVLKGEGGTIMAVDTRGLHKGKPLTEGSRLIFQLEFSSSLFGQSYTSVSQNSLSREYQAMVKKYPDTYHHIFR